MFFMALMKGHSSFKMFSSYIWVQKSIDKPKPWPPTLSLSSYLASAFIRRRNHGVWLVLLVFCASFSIFRFGFSQKPPMAGCSNDDGGFFFNGEDDSRLERESSAGWPWRERIGEIEEREGFWKQPDGLGYRPCLNFSEEYKEDSEPVSGERKRRRGKYLMVVVSGGLNQQRNQIVDAVVIARILEATLVVPILQLNAIWGDDSEFSDIFDEAHFKRTLRNHVRVVSSLPSNRLRIRPVADQLASSNVDDNWIKAHYLDPIQKRGILLLRGLDSRLSKDLPSHLQKLRCKVAFHALKFRAEIEEMGRKLAERMGSEGPYLALHLRLEKDVWVRTGCSPRLGEELDRIVERERIAHPELLTSRTNLTSHRRYLEGLCPLIAMETTRLLKALGASRSTRIYWAGGHPFGGKRALEPLRSNFPIIHNKRTLATLDELRPFEGKASAMAALDYIVSLSSTVFMANHGGNMARALQGHRAYLGHRKHITPNKRGMVATLNTNISTWGLRDADMDEILRNLHVNSLGSPLLRTDKAARDVIAFPVPDCMCRR
ncbi:uncharacterized protein At1g04910 isoform X1 [Amborella trichopoda]|nr:uncharacterized protein At1g04910 isoform X1 [Amborella trichopoda]|eukprot:XP_006830094.2 uncharacterized protein At1g04910 isoform X1 [Amborella trichopoda]